MVPFEQIAIDAVGPWNHKANGSEMKINAHTIIDTCLNPLELKRATQSNPIGRKSVQVPEDAWLSGHPKTSANHL